MARTGKITEPQSIARGNRTRPIAEDARTESERAFFRAGFRNPALVLRWDEIAGPETARLARPIKFTESAQGGILTLKAEPGAALFLQHETRALIARVNTFLGRPEVAKLRFVQAPLIRRSEPRKRELLWPNLPPSDPAIAFQGPEGVHDALLKLARARRMRPKG